jgi:hypothetical protein
MVFSAPALKLRLRLAQRAAMALSGPSVPMFVRVHE